MDPRPDDASPLPSDAIPVVNRTGSLTVFTRPFQLRPPQDALIVVVKGGYRLVSGGPAVPLEEPEVTSGDVRSDAEGDPAGGAGSLVYGSDAALYKPRCDVTLVGHAYPPRETPAHARVTLRLGAALNRTIAVIGDRVWTDRGASTPVPFDRIPLVWERAFGGNGHANNPVGKGYHGRANDPLRNALPNLEHATQTLRAPTDNPPPACFAPIAPEWPQRASKTGDYRGRWATTRAPYFPDDFDWGFFNDAPAEQQIPFPRGDEKWALGGVHPEHAAFEGELPELFPRVFGERLPEHGGGFFEVSLALDTVHFDADQMKLVLVWRGHIDTVDAYASDLVSLYALSYSRRDPPETVEQARVRALAPPPEEPEPEDVAPEDPAADPRPELAARGAVGTPRLVRAAVPVPPRVTREQLLERRALGKPLVGLDCTGADLSNLELDRCDLSGADLTRTNLAGTNLFSAVLAGTVFTGCEARGAFFGNADLSGADFTGADVRECDFSRTKLEDATFARAKADAARFTEAGAAGTDFTGASLNAARFDRAALAHADFTGCSVEGTVFASAVLDDARLYDAHGENVDLTGASLIDFRAEAARLPRLRASGCKANGSVWEGAVLTGATFEGTTLQSAVFARAVLDKVNMNKCDVAEGSFRRAKMREARALRGDFTKATFEGADLTATDLRGANLYGADFLRTKLTRTDWTLAIVAGTRLTPRE